MQVIMYARRQYDGSLIQQIRYALQLAWPHEELDLVMIFDTSSSLICEVPTMVRIFTPKDNHNNTTMTSLEAPANSSHYDAIRLFQHLESSQKSQLIFIEKNADVMNVGSKVIKQLLKTCKSLLPSRRMVPPALKFLETSFSILYQDVTEKGSIDNILKLNTNSVTKYVDLPSSIYSNVNRNSQTSAPLGV